MDEEQLREWKKFLRRWEGIGPQHKQRQGACDSPLCVSHALAHLAPALALTMSDMTWVHLHTFGCELSEGQIGSQAQ